MEFVSGDYIKTGLQWSGGDGVVGGGGGGGCLNEMINWLREGYCRGFFLAGLRWAIFRLQGEYPSFQILFTSSRKILEDETWISNCMKRGSWNRCHFLGSALHSSVWFLTLFTFHAFIMIKLSPVNKDCEHFFLLIVIA